ncbi:4328_t:CDS:2 [Rhizophagus irregularis]|nr:4328_t:CDS:2 [Rhizophagus irregularis]
MVKLDADENCVEISTSWSFKYSLQMRAWRICRWTSRNEEDISSLLTQQGVLKRADNILSWDFDLNIEEIVDMWKKVVVYNVVCCAGRKM